MVGVNKRKNIKRIPPILRRPRPPILNDYSEDETLPPSQSEDSHNADATQVGWRHISRENIAKDVTTGESSHGRTSRPLPADLRNKRIRADNEQENATNVGLRSSSHPSTFDGRRENVSKSNVGENSTRQLQNCRSLPSSLSENTQSDSPCQLDNEANDFNSGSSVPVRGLYKGGNLDKLTNNRKDKLIVYIPPGKYFRPIGQNERKLALWLGYCARSVGRPSDPWEQNLSKHRARLWNMVQDYFDVSLESPDRWKMLEELGKVKTDTPEIKRFKFESYCFYEMRVLFRKWRQRLHKKYEMYSSDEERLKHVPKGLSTNDWKDLMKWFESDDFKAWSAINSENRKALKLFSSSGPTPFAQYEYDLIDEVNGKLPDASDVWMATHAILDEDGQTQFRDSESRTLYEEMKRIENEPRNENESDLTPDEVLQQVFGVRSGYACGKGLGYKVSTKGMVCSSSNTKNDEVNELKNEIARLNEKLEAQGEREKAKDQRFESYFKMMDAIITENGLGTQSHNSLRTED